VVVVWAVVSLIVLASQALAQRPNYLLFTDPQRRFAVEFPREWNWMMVSGSGEPLVTFVHPRKEAAVVVERFRLRLKLERDQVTEVFAEIEADRLKEDQPRATDVVSKLLTENGRRFVLIDYFRPGLDVRERVRQYSFPVGGDVYRITCMAVQSEFSRYENIFGIVAASLKPGAELGPPK